MISPRVPILCFFSLEPPLFLSSYSSSFEIDLYVHERLSPRTSLLLYFFNLPEIVFLPARDRLCHQPPFFPITFHRSRTVYSLHSSFEMQSSTLISSLGALLHYIFIHTTRITSYPQMHFIFALMLKFLQLYIFLNSIRIVQFEFSVIFVPSHSDVLLFAHLSRSSLDLLILSIYLISSFLSVLRVAVSSFSLIARCFTWRRQHQGFTFTLLSSTSCAPLCLTNSFISFSLPSTTLPVCPPTNMYSLLLAFTTSRTFYASFSSAVPIVNIYQRIERM